MSEVTYYVQFRVAADADGRWHTLARVTDRRLADETARLAESAYMRVTAEPHQIGRVVSRSKLRREHALQHAEWELGMGPHRDYGAALVAKAEQRLRAAAGGSVRPEG